MFPPSCLPPPTAHKRFDECRMSRHRPGQAPLRIPRSPDPLRPANSNSSVLTGAGSSSASSTGAGPYWPSPERTRTLLLQCRAWRPCGNAPPRPTSRTRRHQFPARNPKSRRFGNTPPQPPSRNSLSGGCRSPLGVTGCRRRPAPAPTGALALTASVPAAVPAWSPPTPKRRFWRCKRRRGHCGPRSWRHCPARGPAPASSGSRPQSAGHRSGPLRRSGPQRACRGRRRR